MLLENGIIDNMEKEFIPYEQALALQALGFKKNVLLLIFQLAHGK